MKTKQIYQNSSLQNDKSKIQLQNPGKHDENLRVTPKLFKNFDHVSVIQQAMDSINSGEDIFQQFKNFGLETVVLNDDSYEIKQRLSPGNKNTFSDGTSRVSRRTSQADNILDFSHMVKIKQGDYLKSGVGDRQGVILIKLKQVNRIIKIYKKNYMQLKVQISKEVIKSKQESILLIKEYEKKIKQKINQFKINEQKQKQKIRRQIKILKQIIDKKQKQNTQLKNKNKKIQQQTSRQKQINLSNANTTTIHPHSPSKTRQIHNIKTRRFNTQAQDHNIKQPEVIAILNKQLKQIQIDLQLSAQQNKNLKNTIQELEQKLRVSESQQIKNKNNTKNSQNIEVFNKFLQKIQALESQINQMKMRQKEYQSQQNQQWKQQIKAQLRQIDEFLLLCEQRQNKVLVQQKTLQVWQKKLQNKQVQLLRKEQKLKQTQIFLQQQQQQQQQQIGIWQQQKQKSPKKVKIANLKIPSTPENNRACHSSILNQKIYRLSTPRQKNLQSYLSKPGMISKPDLLQRPNHQRNNSKYSEMINNRLNKIQSSIASQLYSLTHH